MELEMLEKVLYHIRVNYYLNDVTDLHVSFYRVMDSFAITVTDIHTKESESFLYSTMVKELDALREES